MFLVQGGESRPCSHDLPFHDHACKHACVQTRVNVRMNVYVCVPSSVMKFTLVLKDKCNTCMYNNYMYMYMYVHVCNLYVCI